jgi:hypothetical protein
VTPEAPVAPKSPVEPVKPVEPYAPVAPFAPEAPEAPVSPSAPATPAVPVIPVAPVTPVAPDEPVAPLKPRAPVVPVEPMIGAPIHTPVDEMTGPTPVIARATAPVGAIVTSAGLIACPSTSCACSARPANGTAPNAIRGAISASQPLAHEVLASQTCIPRNRFGFEARNWPSVGVNGFTEPKSSVSRPSETATLLQHSDHTEVPPLEAL